MKLLADCRLLRKDELQVMIVVYLLYNIILYMTICCMFIM